MLRLTAVMLSCNSARYLERAIQALVRALSVWQAPGHDEVRIVDNGSTDGSLEIIERARRVHGDLVHVHALPTNVGTTVSRNVALRCARGRFVLVVDSDVITPPGTIDHLAARLDMDPSIGVICPRIEYPNGDLQMSTDVFPTVARKAQRYFILKALEARHREQGPGTSRDVDYAISAFWLAQSAAVHRMGLFDENIFYSPEDVDYCVRTWNAGYRVVYDPSVHAVHDAQEISRGIRMITLTHLRGLAYLSGSTGMR